MIFEHYNYILNIVRKQALRRSAGTDIVLEPDCKTYLED
jgi:hypothetical protein